MFFYSISMEIHKIISTLQSDFVKLRKDYRNEVKIFAKYYIIKNYLVFFQHFISLIFHTILKWLDYINALLKNYF